jgi:hypothetical protein
LVWFVLFCLLVIFCWLFSYCPPVVLVILWVCPNSCNSQKKDFFIFWANVVLSVFLRAQNRAFRIFSVLSLVQKIVL